MIYSTKEECCKCGSVSHSLQYYPVNSIRYGNTDEYIEVTCRSCHYAWNRKPKDSDE